MRKLAVVTFSIGFVCMMIASCTAKKEVSTTVTVKVEPAADKPAERPNPNNVYRIAWSRYTGWEFWGYIQDSGIMAKHAQANGITVNVEYVGDYMESVNQYTNGKYDGVAVTNMDALTVPAVGGKDTTVLIVGDFSNGNDGLVVKGLTSVQELKGREVMLYELTVSHYALARWLSKAGMSERDITVRPKTDGEIHSAFAGAPNGAAAVTWNPILMSCRNEKGANLLATSAEIPGEIIDMLVVRTDAPDALKRAVTGAWYEAMNVMGDRTQRTTAVKAMADGCGATEAQFEAQLKTTAMFYRPSDAVAFTESAELKKTMDLVRTFCFDHGMYQTAPSKEYVGTLFPDGDVLGDKKNVKLRFNSAYMQMAAEGSL